MPAPAPTPKPSDEITALIGEGVNGKPLTSAGAARSDSGIRSSAPVSDDYLIHLASWLARYQNYPNDAAEKHEEGKDVIGFTVARDGAVQRIWVDQSSGVPSLDDASVQMVRAASPVPPLPSDLTGSSVDFFFPVNYKLTAYQRLFK
jgi:protein TonB